MSRDYRKYHFSTNELQELRKYLAVDATTSVPDTLNGLPELSTLPGNIVETIIAQDQSQPIYDLDTLLTLSLTQLHQEFPELVINSVYDVLMALAKNYQLAILHNDMILSTWFNLFLEDSETFIQQVTELTNLEFETTDQISVLEYLVKEQIARPRNSTTNLFGITPLVAINTFTDTSIIPTPKVFPAMPTDLSLLKIYNLTNAQLIKHIVTENTARNAELSPQKTKYGNFAIYVEYLISHGALSKLDTQLYKHPRFHQLIKSTVKELQFRVSNQSLNPSSNKLELVMLILLPTVLNELAPITSSPVQLTPGQGYQSINTYHLQRYAHRRHIPIDPLKDIATQLREYDLAHPKSLQAYQYNINSLDRAFTISDEYARVWASFSNTPLMFDPAGSPWLLTYNTIARAKPPRPLHTLPIATVDMFDVTAILPARRQQQLVDMCRTHYISYDVYAQVIPEEFELTYDECVLLQQYPQPHKYITLMRSIHRRIDYFLKYIFDKNFFKDLTHMFNKLDIWNIIISGHWPYFGQYDATRYHEYYTHAQNNPQIKNNLIELYQVSNLDQVAHRPVIPFEQYILQPDKYLEIGLDPILHQSLANYQTVILQYQYVKPSLTITQLDLETMNQWSYHNLKLYRHVLADTTLIELLNIKLVETWTRLDLLHRYSNGLFPHFFIPYNPALRRCQNPDTIVNLLSTTDTTTELLAYGTIFKYVCIDIEDLVDMWQSQPELVGVNPYNVDQPFDYRDLIDLRTKLTSITSSSAQILGQLIDDYLNTRRQTDLPPTITHDYRQLSTDNKLAVQELLWEFFYMAMYMRQWRGPGHPYPLAHASTLTFGATTQYDTLAPVDVDINTSQAIEKIRQHLHQVSSTVRNFVLQLPLYDIDYHRVITSINKYGEILTSICRNLYCIRAASNQYAISSYMYLDKLANIIIPNFDLEIFESIT